MVARMAYDRASGEWGVDWWVWRLVVSERLHVDPVVIRTTWSVRELLEAHVVLDTLELADDAYREDARLKAGTR